MTAPCLPTTASDGDVQRSIELLIDRFEQRGDQTALIWRESVFSYASLARDISTQVEALLEAEPPSQGEVVALVGEHSPRSVAALLALLKRGCIVPLVSPGNFDHLRSRFELAQVRRAVIVDGRSDALSVHKVGHSALHPLLLDLALSRVPGIVLFSSGSSGKVKGVVHDGARFLANYQRPRRAAVTIPFMLFDHVGGLNTMLHILSSGGTAVIPQARTPGEILRLIEAHRVEVLPTTPTFLNLLLLHDFTRHDVSSLRVVAYGAERMPRSTLLRLGEALPHVRFLQTYGSSEAGILPTRSAGQNSLFVRLEGEGVDVRIRNGMLEVMTPTTMLGYLNEASPWTDDGWLRTGDCVEVEGDALRIVGRASDIINVGGEKVYPAEIEDLIAEMPGVVDVVVTGEPNAIVGQIPSVKVELASKESREDFRARMTTFLAGRIEAFKMPRRVEVSSGPLYGPRLKKRRADHDLEEEGRA